MGQPTYRWFVVCPTARLRSLLEDAGSRAVREVARWQRTDHRNRYFRTEYIGLKKRTRGTETSQYLEERTSTETPLVVASERGPGLAQT